MAINNEFDEASGEFLGTALNDFYSGRRPDTGLGDFEPSLTRQEFAAECDINTILAQYEKTGVISHINPRQPMYMDFTNMPNLADALAIVDIASEAFMTLPASVRREFDNDPVKFVAFAENSDNVEKMREWGLAAPKPAPEEPLRVRVVPDAPPVPPPSGDA